MRNELKKSMDNKVYLIDLKEGDRGVVFSIDAGLEASRRLADLGIVPGTELEIVRKSHFRGPLEVKTNNSKLVIGHNLSAKILVKK